LLLRDHHLHVLDSKFSCRNKNEGILEVTGWSRVVYASRESTQHVDYLFTLSRTTVVRVRL